jgi:hypothetical protein
LESSKARHMCGHRSVAVFMTVDQSDQRSAEFHDFPSLSDDVGSVHLQMKVSKEGDREVSALSTQAVDHARPNLL